MSWLTPDIVTSICDYMNRNQPESLLDIARGKGGRPAADSARLIGFDVDRAELEIISAGEAETVDVPWSQQLVSRPHIREELFSLAYGL